MLQLFILGPAFSLPSLDPESIATVALLHLHFRRTQTPWQLISDATATPQPYLLDLDTSQPRRITGFRNIARHLYPQPSPRPADDVALAAFLDAHGSVLLDLSLFVSGENYREATRGEFTRILPWYANYILPPSRRRQACERTASLGIETSSPDVNDKSSPSSDAVFESDPQARASLLLPRKPTLRSLLSSSSFRLHALATSFFTPLQNFFVAHQHLSRDTEIREIDCLVYGYLALMFYPTLPDAWLRETLRRDEFGKLRAWVNRVHNELGLGMEGVLPWTIPSASNLQNNTLSTLIPHLPILGPLCAGTTAIISCRSSSSTWQRDHTSLPLFVLAAGTFGLGIYISFLRAGVVFWPAHQQMGQGTHHIFGRRRWEDYGELGAAIAGVWGSSSQQRGFRELVNGEGEGLGRLDPVGLGVDVQVGRE
ncbi:hypothetical protein M433DRAFT_158864 [Acidomyces richmondensis BFW]|nr:MAG: hypothetical protein FE78DRAFT_86385 [Acidomyces sp. 'richmondensis']KYG41582.1 hypothetical protein M433DRAFT_158864 [Acidomyces richmondensis BFW]